VAAAVVAVILVVRWLSRRDGPNAV
jgi:hypothetical protein